MATVNLPELSFSWKSENEMLKAITDIKLVKSAEKMTQPRPDQPYWFQQLWYGASEVIKNVNTVVFVSFMHFLQYVS